MLEFGNISTWKSRDNNKSETTRLKILIHFSVCVGVYIIIIALIFIPGRLHFIRVLVTDILKLSES